MCNMCRLLNDLDFPLLIAHCSFRAAGSGVLCVKKSFKRILPMNHACFPRRFRAAADLGRVEQETTEKTEIRTSLRFLRLLLFQSDGQSAVGLNLWGSPRSGVQCAKTCL